jgi:hypothetical protein
MELIGLIASVDHFSIVEIKKKATKKEALMCQKKRREAPEGFVPPRFAWVSP